MGAKVSGSQRASWAGAGVGRQPARVPRPTRVVAEPSRNHIVRRCRVQGTAPQALGRAGQQHKVPDRSIIDRAAPECCSAQRRSPRAHALQDWTVVGTPLVPTASVLLQVEEHSRTGLGGRRTRAERTPGLTGLTVQGAGSWRAARGAVQLARAVRAFLKTDCPGICTGLAPPPDHSPSIAVSPPSASFPVHRRTWDRRI